MTAVCPSLVARSRDLLEGRCRLERSCVDEIPQSVSAAKSGVVTLGQAMGYEHVRLVSSCLGEGRCPRPMLVQPPQHGERQPDAIQLDPILDYQSRLDPGSFSIFRHLTQHAVVRANSHTLAGASMAAGH
jgi:hypothetical protein